MREQRPPALDYATLPPARPMRPLDLAGIVLTTVLAGVIVGASMNAVNGIVSRGYFVAVMGWQNVTNVWRAGIDEGVLEGSVAGVLEAIAVGVTVGLVTRGSCPYRKGLKLLAGIVALAYFFWVIGGICGGVLADMYPQFFQSSFLGVPSDREQMLRYAWVGGSIWGAYPGGPIAAIIVLVRFGFGWRRMLTE